jgi:hypothetical protein
MDIFNEENNTASDIEFYLITLDNNEKYQIIPKILSYFRGGISKGHQYLMSEERNV